MNYKKTSQILMLSVCLLGVTACENGFSIRPSMYESSDVTQRPIVIEETRFVEKMSTNDVDYNYLMNLSDDYDHHGSSPLYAVIAYNPDEKNGKLEAFNKSSILKGQLAKLGMRDAVVKTMPINGSENEIVVGYDRLTARGPDNCGKVPGFQTETGAYGDYGLGCKVKDMMAKQIAYPSDLEGKTKMSANDADRAASAVDRSVRSGEPADFVPSYVLSELAGNTSQ